MEASELKEKVRAIMKTHLTSKGYPNISRRAILDELKPMWLKLEAAGLTEELKKLGCTYNGYVQIAIKAAQDAAIKEHLGGFVRANPRRYK